MQSNELERLFSKSRLDTYYRINTQISESLYPLLSNFEIVLRNSIHNSFSIHFKSENWYEQINYPELKDQINVAKSKISISKKEFTYELSEVNETQYYWTGKYEANENTKLFSGFNKKGESLDLLLQRQQNKTSK